MAFEIFKKNSDILRENVCSFRRPSESSEFLGSELLLSNTREAKLNMVNLIKELRKFWERDNFDEKIFSEDGLRVDLYNNSGDKKAQVELEIDEVELFNILESRIKKGVDSFFESLIKAVYAHYEDIGFNVDVINIFLAGNSSKSPIVKKLFEKRIEEFKSEFKNKNIDTDIVIFNPLDNRDDFSRPNGKTGVAFGLIETRSGGVIKVIDRNIKDKDIKFSFYLGRNRRRKFRVVIDRDSEYEKWYEFIDAGDDFEIYYTSSPLAIKNDLPIGDSSIKKVRVSIPDNMRDGDKSIYVKLISPNSFEYGVGESEDGVETINVINIWI